MLRRTRYLSTVYWATSIVSFLSSPTIRGEPQSGFSFEIRRIRSRTSLGTLGRPGLRLWLSLRQWSRNQHFCHSVTVLGWRKRKMPSILRVFWRYRTKGFDQWVSAGVFARFFDRQIVGPEERQFPIAGIAASVKLRIQLITKNGRIPSSWAEPPKREISEITRREGYPDALAEGTLCRDGCISRHEKKPMLSMCSSFR